MVKRRGDVTPEPPGGRAAERLRMFEESRRFVPEEQAKKKPGAAAKNDPKKGKREGPNAKQGRRKV
jgi:hypothetical protein